jgi:hypothetical protein
MFIDVFHLDDEPQTVRRTGNQATGMVMLGGEYARTPGRAVVCTCIRAGDVRVISVPDPECMGHA